MKYPDGIREAAARFGCQLTDTPRFARFGIDIGGSVKVDTKGIRASVNAPASWPVSPSAASAPAASTPAPTTNRAVKAVQNAFSAVKPAPVKTANRAVSGNAFSAVKTPEVVGRPTALAIPLTIDPQTALAMADKLLGDSRVVNGPQTVQNTITLATIPRSPLPPPTHDAIVRGAAVLDAAQQIRDSVGAEPGTAAVPPTADLPAAEAASAYPLSDVEIAALDAFAPPPATTTTWWKRWIWLPIAGGAVSVGIYAVRKL